MIDASTPGRFRVGVNVAPLRAIDAGPRCHQDPVIQYGSAGARPQGAARVGSPMAAGGATAPEAPAAARGPLDLVVQLAVLAFAYWAWRHARGAVDGSMTASFAHARDLVDAERSLGALFEPSVQSWAVNAGWPAEVARWGYANLHFKGSCLMLAVLYFGYRGSYGFVRNAVLAAMVISVLCYALYPTAPPRFLPELGLDPSSAVTGNNPSLTSGRCSLQPVRRGPLDARRPVGDPRLVPGDAGPAPPGQGAPVRLSAPDDVRGGCEREPLLARCGLRADHRDPRPVSQCCSPG